MQIVLQYRLQNKKIKVYGFICMMALIHDRHLGDGNVFRNFKFTVRN